ncbi:NAD-dependent protein deacetylase sirtuin-2-like [Styela clava]
MSEKDECSANNDPNLAGSSEQDESLGATGGAELENGNINFLEKFMEQLKLFNKPAQETEDEKPKPEQLLKEVTFQGVSDYIQSPKCKNIIVLSGAGISTSAGIPDFRSPGSGLYDNLQKFDLPSPQSIFEISYFKQKPEAFFTLAKELYPGEFKPTISHYFIKLLETKKLLLRAYTQNIDTLERVAGISDDKIVEAHGTFHTSHCLSCGKSYTQSWMRDVIFKDEIPRCTDESCGGLIKPDIVFFGESLPPRFHTKRMEDFNKCDLLIVMGTSLKVQPFASLVDSVPDTTPRLLINREKSGSEDVMLMMIFGGGMRFDDEDNYRDVFWEGNCDDGCRALCSLLGWLKELDELVETERKKIDEAKTKM